MGPKPAVDPKYVQLEERMDSVMELQDEMEVRLCGEISTLSQKMDDFGGSLKEIMKQLKGKDIPAQNPADFPPLHAKAGASKGANGSSPSPLNQRHQETFNPWGTKDNTVETPSAATFRGYRMDFPRFDGENPHGWIRKCNNFFLMNRMPDFEKICMASVYMEGRAEYWYHDYVEGKENMMWCQVAEMVLESFSPANAESVVAEFNKLKQTTTVLSYQIRFEELKSFMISNNRYLTESYFVDSFLSGLKEEIKQMVYMLGPRSLTQAIYIAKKQEALLEA